MNNKPWAFTKLQLKNLKIAYFITALGLIQLFIKIIAVNFGSNLSNQIEISGGCFLWLLILLAAIFIPGVNFKKFINLGGKREIFFWGSLMTYVLLCIIISFCNTIIFYTLDNIIISKNYFEGLVNLIQIFGWNQNGMIITFFQQFAFLLLAATAIHTLTAIQDKWYGWITDVAIIAFLTVFITISPLRQVLISFFILIVFHTNALMQIANCLILTCIIYSLNKPILSRKII